MTLRGSSIESLRDRVRLEHGPEARIVSAERVSPSGIGKFRPPPYFEATVEVADTSAERMPVPSRFGISALLADADDAEDRLRESGTPGTAASTSAAEFDEIIARISGFTGTEDSRPQPEPEPEVLTPEPEVLTPAPVIRPVFRAIEAPRAVAPRLCEVPGDLVAIVGIGQDPLPVAQSMARHATPGDVRGGGAVNIRDKESLTDRRSALLARAEGVENGRIVYAAFGIVPGTDFAQEVRGIDADQVWVVVDAGRKPEDTARWVRSLATVTGVSAIAVIGTALTATPESVEDLGLPVGWADGAFTEPDRA